MNVEESIKILKNSIKPKDKILTEIINNSDKIIETVNDEVLTPKTIELKSQELETIIPVVKEQSGKIEDSDFFKDVEYNTEQDYNNNINSDVQDDDNEDDLDNDKDDFTSLCRSKAETQTQLIELLGQIICCLITFDFSPENQKKFKFSIDKFKGIKKSITSILLASKKKIDPKKDLIFLIIGSYIPMLVIAIGAAIHKHKIKKIQEEERIKTIKLNKDKNIIFEKNKEFDFKENVIDNASLQIIKKETRGRKKGSKNKPKK